MAKLCMLEPGDKAILVVSGDCFLLQIKSRVTMTDENKFTRCDALSFTSDMIEPFYNTTYHRVCLEWGLVPYSSFSVDVTRTMVLVFERE